MHPKEWDCVTGLNWFYKTRHYLLNNHCKVSKYQRVLCLRKSLLQQYSYNTYKQFIIRNLSFDILTFKLPFFRYTIHRHRHFQMAHARPRIRFWWQWLNNFHSNFNGCWWAGIVPSLSPPPRVTHISLCHASRGPSIMFYRELLFTPFRRKRYIIIKNMIYLVIKHS